MPSTCDEEADPERSSSMNWKDPDKIFSTGLKVLSEVSGHTSDDWQGKELN